MILFYSGYGCKLSDPEAFLPRRGRPGHVMLTAIDSVGKKQPERRVRRLKKLSRQAKVPV